MKIIITCFILLLQISLLANKEENSVESNIHQVTVFESGAQVYRTANTTIPKGTSILKFVNIAPHILSNSIQVKGNGDFTILSVKYNQNFLNKAEKSEELKHNFATRDSISSLIGDKQTYLIVLKEEYSMITSNKSIGGQNGVKAEELKATSDFFKTRLKEIKQEELSLSREIKKLSSQVQDLLNQEKNLSRSIKDYTSEIILSIESSKQTKADFIFSYLVKNAGWFANYDARVKDVNSPVELLYKGKVYQTSGEDWTDVKLTLSTGNPQENATKPVLAPWWIGYNQRNQNQRQYYEPGAYSGLTWNGQDKIISGIITDRNGDALIGASVLIKGTSVGTITNIDGAYSIEVPNGADKIIVSYLGYENFETKINSAMMNVVLRESNISLDQIAVTASGIRKNKSSIGYAVEEIRKTKRLSKQKSKNINLSEIENTTSIEFKIENPYTIPSDGQQYTVRMIEHSLEADYEYYCAPKINDDAFLTAEIPDWSDLHLLTGELNIFFKDSYLGKTMLNAENVSDTLTISLGVDKDIVVQRTKIKDLSKRRIIGLKKIESRSWDIEVLNKKNQPIKIVIEDQFPVPTNEDIVVDKVNYEGAELDEDTGILSWNQEIQAGGSTKTNFAYSIKYNKRKYVLLE